MSDNPGVQVSAAGVEAAGGSAAAAPVAGTTADAASRPSETVSGSSDGPVGAVGGVDEKAKGRRVSGTSEGSHGGTGTAAGSGAAAVMSEKERLREEKRRAREAKRGKRKVEKVAAVRIQKVARGVSTRLLWGRMKTSSVEVQRVYRGHLARVGVAAIRTHRESERATAHRVASQRMGRWWRKRNEVIEFKKNMEVARQLREAQAEALRRQLKAEAKGQPARALKEDLELAQQLQDAAVKIQRFAVMRFKDELRDGVVRRRKLLARAQAAHNTLKQTGRTVDEVKSHMADVRAKRAKEAKAKAEAEEVERQRLEEFKKRDLERRRRIRVKQQRAKEAQKKQEIEAAKPNTEEELRKQKEREERERAFKAEQAKAARRAKEKQKRIEEERRQQEQQEAEAKQRRQVEARLAMEARLRENERRRAEEKRAKQEEEEEAERLAREQKEQAAEEGARKAKLAAARVAKRARAEKARKAREEREHREAQKLEHDRMMRNRAAKEAIMRTNVKPGSGSPTRSTDLSPKRSPYRVRMTSSPADKALRAELGFDELSSSDEEPSSGGEEPVGFNTKGDEPPQHRPNVVSPIEHVPTVDTAGRDVGSRSRGPERDGDLLMTTHSSSAPEDGFPHDDGSESEIRIVQAMVDLVEGEDSSRRSEAQIEATKRHKRRRKKKAKAAAREKPPLPALDKPVRSLNDDVTKENVQRRSTKGFVARKSKAGHHPAAKLYQNSRPPSEDKRQEDLARLRESFLPKELAELMANADSANSVHSLPAMPTGKKKGQRRRHRSRPATFGSAGDRLTLPPAGPPGHRATVTLTDAHGRPIVPRASSQPAMTQSASAPSVGLVGADVPLPSKTSTVQEFLNFDAHPSLPSAAAHGAWVPKFYGDTTLTQPVTVKAKSKGKKKSSRHKHDSLGGWMADTGPASSEFVGGGFPRSPSPIRVPEPIQLHSHERIIEPPAIAQDDKQAEGGTDEFSPARQSPVRMDAAEMNLAAEGGMAVAPLEEPYSDDDLLEFRPNPEQLGGLFASESEDDEEYYSEYDD